MGEGLALNARSKGWQVVGHRRSGVQAKLRRAGVIATETLDDLPERLAPPRLILISIPAGPSVDETLDNLLPLLAPGDVVADAGNSYWGDSVRRHRQLARRKVGLVDLGTSGGVSGARSGACFMVGGRRRDFLRLKPLLSDLAMPGGIVHAGGPGAGHYVKLIHNGIEFGMLQALGEGYGLLRAGPVQVDVPKTLQAWRHGSVIRSWLLDLLVDAEHLDDVPPYVEDTGEVNWLIEDALRAEVPIPGMSAAVMELAASRDRKGWRHRAIAGMRHGFGGHPYGPDSRIAKERKTGRVDARWPDNEPGPDSPSK